LRREKEQEQSFPFTRSPLPFYTISKKLGYSLSPQPPLETGALVRRALVDRCVAPVDRNGITSLTEPASFPKREIMVSQEVSYQNLHQLLGWHRKQ
jgi:hypothetical protein